MKLLLYNKSDVLSDRVSRSQRFLSIFKRVFSSDATTEAFFYLLERGACTAWLMQIHLEMPEATAYRAIKTLRTLQIVEQRHSVKMPRGVKRGGPKPKIWGLVGCTRKEEAKAYRDHVRAQSPKYRAAEKYVQDFLGREEKEITMNRIKSDLRHMQVRESYDVATLAAEILHERGIKVWR